MPTTRHYLLFLCCVLSGISVAAQTGLKGTVKTQKGEPLPYAAIAVRGTSTGTIANEEGAYRLDLKPGYYELVFQYLGYQTGMKAITITDKTEVFDAVLAEQALQLSEVRVGAGNEDPAYTIMRRAIAKSRYHLLQVSSYKAKAYTKSSLVITDLPLEFLVKKRLEKIANEENFKKGVPILNETVSEIEFHQPNTYKQKVIASRNSQDNSLINPNEYILTSFYKPEIAKTVSPLSPKAFAYYKFEYLGSFRENGVEVNKIKVTPKSYGEGVFKGTIHIIEDLWCLYSLDLQTHKQGFRLEVKQLYSPIQQVWMPVNQKFHAEGGIYGVKGKGDYVIAQTFSELVVNPTFAPEIVVLDEKKEQEEARSVQVSKQDLKTKELEELLRDQKSFSAKNLRKLMKEYDKQQFETAKEQGEDVDMKERREQTTEVDSMANRRNSTYWDSLRTVPLTRAETISYNRLDSMLLRKSQEPAMNRWQRNPARDTTARPTRNKGAFGVGDLFLGATYPLSKDKSWKLQYKSPLAGLQINTVEGLVVDGLGLSLQHTRKPVPGKTGYRLRADALARYSLERNKLLPSGVLEYGWQRNTLSLQGGRGISQLNPDTPIAPLLNSVSTLFFEQNLAKIYQKDYLRAGFDRSLSNDHFQLKFFAEYADRTALANAEKAYRYRLINWNKRDFTSNTPQHPYFEELPGTLTPMENHLAFTAGLSASWKPWQQYRIQKGKTTYYKDDTPAFSLEYRKGVPNWFGSTSDFDFLKAKITHGFNTGIKSRLLYQVAAGAFLNRNQVHFPDFNHFAGNLFFFQLGDPVGTFRMLDYYRLSTDRQFAELHTLAEFRQLLLTQLPLFRILGVKETVILHYLATPDSRHYTELGYGFDIGIRFPFRVEVVNSFEKFRYQQTVFRIGTTMNFPF